jgi:tRNA G18 (ribose-2'-O)-methylase SpoU
MTSEKVPPPAEMHFIVQNVSKKHNIGTICRNCTAFDVKSMHLVGSAHYNVFGSQGSDAHVKIEHHPTLEECRETMRETYNVEEILGVEITEESVDVAKYPWKGNTAFVLGE